MTLEVDLIRIDVQTLNPFQSKMLFLSPVIKIVTTATALVPTVLVVGSENAQAKVLEVRMRHC